MNDSSFIAIAKIEHMFSVIFIKPFTIYIRTYIYFRNILHNTVKIKLNLIFNSLGDPLRFLILRCSY